MKRFFDIILSFLLIILLSPLIIVLIILTSVTSKGGPFFFGPRVGKNGKIFKIVKFRSMKIKSEGHGTWNVSGKDSRITKFGYFLRKTKLDEIPQLFNILIGNMSFVGPRPELPVYVDCYSSLEMPILDNRPGLTDWASIVHSDQIVGFTNAQDPDEYYFHVIRPLKLKLQLYYRYNRNIFSDFHCLLWTFWKVVSKTKKNPKKIQKIIDDYSKEESEKAILKTKVEKITIPHTDLKVSRICFGGCPMGGYGWGETHKNDFIEAIRYALDIGMNFFDTADTYGLGESEKILGEAIKGRREEVVIATKFGVRRDESGHTFYDNSPEWIKEALENSLRRLGTDYVDLYYIHFLDHKTPLSLVVETLEQLQKEGKIRYYGLSNVKKEDLEDIKRSKGKFVSIQDEYSLLTRKNEEDLLFYQKELNMTPMTWGSLSQGLLAGKITKETVFGKDDRRSRDIYINFHGEKFERNLLIVEDLRKMAQNYKVPISSVAIRFTLDNLKNSVALVGVKNISQLKENIQAYTFRLNKKDLAYLNKILENEK
ncbi:MAG: aldo/keto reductase [Bacilli bacterium]|jgi:aryl-alcohol dehydrogenase-like predicted oxidoreductase/lipopolysaccharide/colanic/teichoic acid biosynthesis glycosyltransferase